jgi:hypothetical protein
VDDPSPERPDVERAGEPEDETDRPLPLLVEGSARMVLSRAPLEG